MNYIYGEIFDVVKWLLWKTKDSEKGKRGTGCYAKSQKKAKFFDGVKWLPCNTERGLGV